MSACCWGKPPLLLLFLVAACVTGAVGEVIKTYNFTGPVPHTGYDHFFLPFSVLPGTVEVEVQHHHIADPDNILDWGLNDTQGMRGWGGGNLEPIVVNELAASRSYHTGPVLPGTWSVVVGKPRIVTYPAVYQVIVTLRDAVTLQPQTERSPYKPSPPLNSQRRWYAGDFHVHSFQSGDARPTLPEIGTFARGVGLDFVVLTDHNTNTQCDYINSAQAQFPDLLFIPGVEWTTYYGHANGIGATEFVDFKVGLPGVTMQGAREQFRKQGALFSMNHFNMYYGGGYEDNNKCVGCTWDYFLNSPDDPKALDAMEIAIQGWTGAGAIFSPRAIDFWDHLCFLGYSPAAVGGSDDHKGGNDTFPDSPIGNPTTMVLADDLSVASIIKGVKAGDTVVKMYGPEDPMVVFELFETSSSSSSSSSSFNAVVTVSDFRGPVASGRYELLLIKNKWPIHRVNVTAARASDDFTFKCQIERPSEGRDRWRAQLNDLSQGSPRVITSHKFIYP